MIQFFYGYTKANLGILIPEQTRSQQAKNKVCQIHAWH